MKFKVGDKVKIIRNKASANRNRFIGLETVIYKIENYDYPYYLGSELNPSTPGWVWSDDELELIN